MVGSKAVLSRCLVCGRRRLRASDPRTHQSQAHESAGQTEAHSSQVSGSSILPSRMPVLVRPMRHLNLRSGVGDLCDTRRSRLQQLLARCHSEQDKRGGAFGRCYEFEDPRWDPQSIEPAVAELKNARAFGIMPISERFTGLNVGRFNKLVDRITCVKHYERLRAEELADAIRA